MHKYCTWHTEAHPHTHTHTRVNIEALIEPLSPTGCIVIRANTLASPWLFCTGPRLTRALIRHLSSPLCGTAAVIKSHRNMDEWGSDWNVQLCAFVLPLQGVLEQEEIWKVGQRGSEPDGEVELLLADSVPAWSWTWVYPHAPVASQIITTWFAIL